MTTPPTTDTRAALEAAIDAYAQAAIDAYAQAAIANRRATSASPDERVALTAAWAAIAPAITAHVAAEIARRLACAPGVDLAIEEYGDACQQWRNHHGPTLGPIEDRERAVVEARPTPDEARRLVDDFAEAVANGVSAPERGPYPVPDSVEQAIVDAEAALLRALGVEA